jgi:hypothetical protein
MILIKTIPFFLLLITFASCAKKHSCQCSVTYIKTGYDPYITTSKQEIENKCSNKRAEKICNYTEQQLQKNLSAGHKSADETIKTTCTVK